MTDLEGTTIGNYLIQKRLGTGAMGAVYLAVHGAIGKRLAIKILAGHLTDDRGMVERFMLEARAIGQLEHPNIIEMFDYGTLEDGRLYYTMEYLQGETLSQRIKRGKVTLGELRDVLVQVCDALEVVHHHGIIHRDLKPSNIFLAHRGSGMVVKLLDFGIAKIPNADGGELTSTGAVLGTPVYMSPEQALAQNYQVTHLSDIYSLGVILYKCLCGNYPIVGSLIPEVVAYHLLQETIPIRQFNPGIPDAIDRVVMRCLRKKPLERFGSAQDLCDAFVEACRQLPDETVFVTQDMVDPDLLVSTNPRGRLPEGAGVETADCNPAEHTTEHPETDVTDVEAEDTHHHIRRKRQSLFTVPFFGRKRELTFIQVFLDRDTVCLEITGEPGVGKTALVEQALLTVAGGDTRVLRVLPEGEGFRRSWQPVTDLFSRLTSLPAEPSRTGATSRRFAAASRPSPRSWWPPCTCSAGNPSPRTWSTGCAAASSSSPSPVCCTRPRDPGARCSSSKTSRSSTGPPGA